MASTIFTDGVTPIVSNWLNDVDNATYRGGATFIQSGTGAVPRTVQDKERDILNVKDGGVVGDGVADETAALQAMDDAAAPGSKLEFQPGKSYKISDTVNFRNIYEIDGKGSTIVPSGGLLIADKAGFYCGKQLADYPSITPFSLALYQMSATLPAGVTASVGDLIHFKSNTVRITGYNHGMYATVLSVSGQDINFSTAAYAAFQVDAITVYRGHKALVVKGLHFDWTSIPNALAYTEALNVHGTNILIHGCTFAGSIYAGGAARVNGENAVIERCRAYGFFNTQGITGGGRVGYGFVANANNTTIKNCVAIGNKHSMTSGARDAVILNVIYENSVIYENPSLPLSGYFSASLDFHCNVIGATVRDNYIITQDNAINVRNEAALIHGNTIIQNNSGYLIRSSEQGYDGVVFKNNRVFLQANSTVLGTDSGETSTTYFRNCVLEDNEFLSTAGNLFYSSMTGATLKGVRIARNHFNGDSLFRMDGSTSIDTLEIDDNTSDSLTVGLARITAPSIAANKNIRITRNRSKLATGSGAPALINMFSVAASKDLVIAGLTIDDNTLDATLNSGSAYCVSISSTAASNVEFTNNKYLRSANFRGVNFNDVSLTDGSISNNIGDKDLILTATTLGSVNTRVKIRGNTIQGVLSLQESTADNVYVDCDVTDNTALNIAVTTRSGSTAWAASNELHLIDNRTTTGGLVISTNATGNKVRVRGGALYTKLIDNSSAFYAPPLGVAVLTGAAISWNGSTTVGYDGTLYKSSVPTAGTWAVSNRVLNSAPAVGSPKAWVCTVAGTPGTWVSEGNL